MVNSGSGGFSPILLDILVCWILNTALLVCSYFQEFCLWRIVSLQWSDDLYWSTKSPDYSTMMVLFIVLLCFCLPLRNIWIFCSILCFYWWKISYLVSWFKVIWILRTPCFKDLIFSYIFWSFIGWESIIFLWTWYFFGVI